MKFSGERFIPGQTPDPELEIEHTQRYYSLRDAVKGKTVLDAACGEGYGSHYLALSAAKVYGIDISRETIEHARQTYQRENLSFIEGSVAEIPLPEASVDIVVSYETIEHLDEETQHHFLQEVGRVLRPDGFLVMSTPNKSRYSDQTGYRNEFHLKEFYQEEFEHLLGQYFGHVRLYHQSFEVVSVLRCHDTRKLELLNELNTEKKLDVKSLQQSDGQSPKPTDGKYLIAVCSVKNTFNHTINKTYINLSSAVISFQKYDQMMERILELQQEVERKNSHIELIKAELDARDSIVLDRGQRIEELSHWGLTLERELEELRQEYSAVLSGRYETHLAELKEKEQIIENQRVHINQLLEQERILQNIYASHGWKLLNKYYRMKDFIFPGDKRRTVWARIVLRLFKEPSAIGTHVNPQNIKKFLRYLITEDIRSLGNKLDQYFLRFNEQTRTELKLYWGSHPRENMVFPITETPLVSIIIPVCNQWAYTYSCLRSILENTREIEYEVVIADDVSTDETIHIKEYVANIRVVRQEQNLGFLKNCNAAASEAKGKYLVFLNNDTNVQARWLDALLELAESDPKIGLVGSKLIYSDGKLQEAGGIIWSDASGWNYGRLDDPEKPEYNYVKEADYISGASIMIRCDLWRQIGGFDERYAPAYFEDADLAFEVRRHGYKVLYQPRSVVIHFEGKSHGTDTGSGVKRYQVVNKEKFSEKWKNVLLNEHFENGKEVFWARDRSQGQKTILVIDHYVPHFDQDAGSKTTFQYLKLFVDMGFNVKFLGDNLYRHEPYTGALQQLGIEVLYGEWYRDHWRKWAKKHSEKFNYVYLNRPHIAEKYIDFFRQETKARIIYYGHDLHYLRELREYEINPNPKIQKSSLQWKLKELAIINKSDMAYYPSPVEVEEIKKELPQARVKAIPAYVFADGQVNTIQDFAQRKDIMFVGGFAHRPNLDGILWFLEEIFPQVVSKLPEIKLYIVGSNTPEILKEYSSPNVLVTGYIGDQELHEYYQKIRMVVVPLRYGAGIKGKIVEALYYQVPVVTTGIGAEGLEEGNEYLKICDDENVFAQTVVELYGDLNMLQEMSGNAKNYVQKYFSRDSVLNVLFDEIRNGDCHGDFEIRDYGTV